MQFPALARTPPATLRVVVSSTNRDTARHEPATRGGHFPPRRNPRIAESPARAATLERESAPAPSMRRLRDFALAPSSLAMLAGDSAGLVAARPFDIDRRETILSSVDGNRSSCSDVPLALLLMHQRG